MSAAVRNVRRPQCRLVGSLLPALCATVCTISCYAGEEGTTLARLYAEQVDRRIEFPVEEQQGYAAILSNLTADKGMDKAQYLVLVDRNEFVQAAMIYWMSAERTFYFIGASPVSTGKPGAFDHFITPTGVFEHNLDSPDFRAEGTRNKLGVRGYGVKGMRVFDFGWQVGTKGWGKGGIGTMRLQMHATDPDLLENRMGTPQSKGCIRIPASLDWFLDRYGILDADYEDAVAMGKTFWVLSKLREPTPWSGKFLIVVDTGRHTRPEWDALPVKNARQPLPKKQS